MNKQNLSTLQVFQSFSHKGKSIVNLLEGSLQRKRRHHVTKTQNEVCLLSSKIIFWKQRSDVRASKFVSMRHNSEFPKKLLDRLDAKECQNSDIFPFCTASHYEKKEKPKFKNGDIVRISKCGLPFEKGYKPQFTNEVLGIVASSSGKPPTYKTKVEQNEIVRSGKN